MRTVGVFCNTFLPYSQTFVWDEIRSHERYAVEVFAWRRINHERFPAQVMVARPWYPVLRRSRRFDDRFRRGGIDLVHAHFGWAGVPAENYARRYDLPLVVSFHGYDVALLASGGPMSPRLWPYTLFASRMLHAMDLGLCASAELVEMLVALGVPRDRLVEHRLGVDLEKFRPQPKTHGSLRTAMVGRFVAKKGFADGIRAFAMFRHAWDERAVLRIAGTGPLEAELRRCVAAVGVQQDVEFLGALSHDRVANLLAETDVLLAPSVVADDGDRDSGLMSVKEASASGCVAIATRHGGIPSIIDDGITGFLVNEREVDAIARHLTTLARDLQLRSTMATAARRKMQLEYALVNSVRKLEDFYDEAIRRHRASDRLSAGTRR